MLSPSKGVRLNIWRVDLESCLLQTSHVKFYCSRRPAGPDQIKTRLEWHEGVFDQLEHLFQTRILVYTVRGISDSYIGASIPWCCHADQPC